jgi:hypothetical protein
VGENSQNKKKINLKNSNAMTETNFKELWQAQNTTSNTDSKEIVLKAKHLQRKTRIKLFLSNLLLFATMLFIIGVVLYFK